MIKYVVALIVLSTLLISAEVSAKNDAVNTGWFNNIAIKGYDSVAYFTQNKAIKGSEKYTVNYLGADWHFASAENKTLFEEQPKRYAPQYGGWCAYAMADEGNAVGVDPEAFYIYKDKLYLNYSQSVQQKWLSNLLPYIVMADGYYPQTTNVMTFQ